MSSEAIPTPGPPRRSSAKLPILGCLFALAAAGLLVVVAVVILVAVFAKPFLEQRIVERARERGFEVEIGHLELGWTLVSLNDVDVRLVGVRGVGARLDRVEVALERLEPASVVARGVDLQLEGSAPAMALELAEWAKTYPPSQPGAYRGSFTAEQVQVAWREAAGDEPWLELAGGKVTPTKEGGSLTARKARVVGVELGRVGAGWTATEAVVDLGFGAAQTDQAPVRILVRHGEEPPTALFTLNPTPLHQLSEPLGAKLPIDEDVKLSGEVELTLPQAFQRGSLTGRMHLTLDGYVPPHPVELSGFVFGDSTTIESQITLSEDRSLVTLEGTRLTAGKFTLEGQGKVQRFQTHAHVQIALRGDLPCGALASAAAHTRLGQTLGKIVGPAASQLVKGSVAVLVKVDADTRRLSEARVLRTIGVGCGLKPIPIPGIGTIDLGDVTLDDLSKLPSGIPSSLPPLPSSLPPFPAPGGFSFPPLAAPGDRRGSTDPDKATAP